jgi:hypothetical protein
MSRSSNAALLVRAGQTLRLTNKELAETLGCSRRTIQRWIARETSMVSAELCHLAKLVHPTDAALAAELATNAHETLETLGLVRPLAPPPPPAAPRLPPLRQISHAVVCVAAEAMNLPPSALRPALYAAFRCARELGLSVEEAEKGLAPETGQRSTRKTS